MNQPTPDMGISHEEAKKLVADAVAPLHEAIERLIHSKLEDHGHELPGFMSPISLKELKAGDAMVQPQTLMGQDGPIVVILTRRPVASPDGINRYKLIAYKMPDADQPTPEGGESLVPFTMTLFQENPVDITLSTVVSPSPMIETELLRQLVELGPNFDGAAMFHVAILVLNNDPVDIPDLPTPQQ